MSNLFSFAHVMWSKVSGVSCVEKGLLSHEARSSSGEESFVLRDRGNEARSSGKGGNLRLSGTVL